MGRAGGMDWRVGQGEWFFEADVMAKPLRKKADSEQPDTSLVPVIYARNLTEAEFYKGLLTSNDIPAILEDASGEVIGLPESVVGRGVPVLVPNAMLDEASEIIAEHQDTEEDKALDEFEELEEDEEFEDDDEEFEDDDEEEDDDLDELDELDGDLDEDLDDDLEEDFEGDDEE